MGTKLSSIVRCLRPKRALVLTALLGLGAAVALAVGFQFVDDPSVFQLDGDAVQSNTHSYTGDDWDNVMNNGGGGGNANATILDRTGIVGDFGSGDQIFTGGASKDIGGINDSNTASKDWGWAIRSGPPDKDDLTDAYAVAYKVNNNGTDELWAYFGADRYDNSGDALLGFWFFQDNVGPIAGGRFSGNHVNGDLLVIASFTNGGSTPNINVEKWSCGNNVGMNCDLNGQLVDAVTGLPPDKTTVGVPELCNPANPSQFVCAITNTGGQTVPTITGALGPWTYHNKSAVTSSNTTGLSTTFPAQTFFEGGINISHFFASGQTPCFSVFMAETRSSSDFTKAVGKDFVKGHFNTCGISVSKTCGTGVIVNGGTQLQYPVTISITQSGFGGGAGFNLTSVDDVTTVVNGDGSGSPSTVDIGNAFDATCPSGTGGGIPLGTITGSPSYNKCITVAAGKEATSNQVTITATFAGATKTSTSSNVSCSQPTFGTLSVTKSCVTQLPVQAPSGNTTVVAAEVQASATVCNDSGEQYDSISVSDSGAGALSFICASPMLGCTVGNTVTSFSLPPKPSGGTSCASSSGKNYLPSKCDGPNDPTTSAGAGVCSFSDTVTVSGTDHVTGVVLGNNGTTKPIDNATCHYCPGGNPNFCNAPPTDPQ